MARKRRWGESKRRPRRSEEASVPAAPSVRGRRGDGALRGMVLPIRIVADDLRRTRSKHVHGRLRVLLGGRDLPSMGYGPGDVCLHGWAEALRDAVGSLARAPRARYVYDSGDSGVPAFEFRRDEDVVFISIIDAINSSGEADPRWQHVGCDFRALTSQIRQFLEWYDGMESDGWPSIRRDGL
ncbi:MAG: hypothetical protein ACYCW6_01515 [Candidatus Xenobia bacterium]